ncbi:selenoprotein H-like [Gossypium australe]|uniref:Selenoprotein H-like n=1 Tax=Gossypium australe TaxID=47621 RepID=A0A5B6X945_9ROSI|nr:selenoprotein H-like [Gossypium australe]
MEGDGDGDQPKPQVQETLKRVTRSMTKQPHPESLPTKEKPKAKAKKQKKSADEDGAKAEAAPEELAVADGGSYNKTVVVEHCKQCNSFKTRAFQVRDGLEKGVPWVLLENFPPLPSIFLLNVCFMVYLSSHFLSPNFQQPRRGCFEIREEGGETFISLLDMKRPFKPMKELDMEKVISDIIEKIK